MLYKTIILEVIQSRPQLHRKLRQEKMLLRTINYYAPELKWIARRSFLL